MIPLTTLAGHQRIGFAHTDPAGLVFYPRYLDMFNNLIESESSLRFIIDGSVDGVRRVTALPTLAFVAMDSFETVAVPLDIRESIERYLA